MSRARRLAPLLVLFAAHLSAACAASGAAPATPEAPPYAGAVRVESELEPDELFAALRAALAHRGWSARGARPLVTEPVILGPEKLGPEILGEVHARFRLRPASGGLVASGEFAVQTSTDSESEILWRLARNAEGGGGEVFAALVDLCRELPHERLIYLFEE